MKVITHAITFTAREAARITGVSPVQQRNYRRHGYLQGTDAGWNRFGPSEIAELFVMNQLSERGIAPAHFRSILWPENTASDWAGLVLEWSKQHGAILTDPEGVRPVEVRIPPRPKRLPRYAVLSSSGQTLIEDLSSVFDGSRDMMTAIVLDLAALGYELIEQTGALWYEEEILNRNSRKSPSER